jgi:hypothetical protein
MTEYEQLRQLCRRNRDLAHENERIRAELCDKAHQISELEEVNANLCVERDATDYLLGVAMDELPGGGGALV